MSLDGETPGASGVTEATPEDHKGKNRDALIHEFQGALGIAQACMVSPAAQSPGIKPYQILLIYLLLSLIQK